MEGMCAPTIIGIGIAILSLIGHCVMLMRTKNTKETPNAKIYASNHLIYSVLVQSVYVFTLYMLCKYGHETVAWILLLLPIIIIVVMIIVMRSVMMDIIRIHKIIGMRTIPRKSV